MLIAPAMPSRFAPFLEPFLRFISRECEEMRFFYIENPFGIKKTPLKHFSMSLASAVRV